MSDRTTPVVVVTNIGPSERLTRCLASVERSGNGPIVVVDNSGATPDDHVADAAGTACRKVLAVPNKGYGAAANSGFTAARRLVPDTDVVVLLNDDIEVAPGWVAPLWEAIDAGYDVVQPKLLVARGAASTPTIVNSVGVHLDASGAGVDIGYGEPDGPAFEHAADIEIFTGGAVMFTADFLDRTGGFDERYFLYYEDVDLALRGAELGCRFRCAAESHVWHEGGATTSALGDETHRLQERNRLWCAFRFADASVIGRALWLSVRRLRHAPRKAHVRALVSGIVGGPTRLWERRSARRAGKNGAGA